MMFLHRVSVGRRVGLLVVIAWSATAAAGFFAIEAYEFTPGVMGRASSDWPEGATLGFVSDRPNVVMAVHPRCPCTQVSLDQLAELVRRFPDRASLRLLVFRPEGSVEGWGGSAIPGSADGLAGVIRVDDPGGREAGRFGLTTSGAVAAYDELGNLRFFGGLTAGRGHGGPSEGAEALAAVLTGSDPTRGKSAVFGCVINRPSRGGERR
ncbi:RedB protein [Tundrisphaera lichenicola]|uniref:RedB protein n=1 Tax=Tundrisphaera lichenicola TaxID=2029860 RepID=UPI003EBFD227